jgi:hypothetical protein
MGIQAPTGATTGPTTRYTASVTTPGTSVTVTKESVRMTPLQIMDCRNDWERLHTRERRKVARLAKHGESHPDPRTARIAYGWALSVKQADSEPDSRRRRWSEHGVGLAVGILLDLIGMIVSAPFGGEGTGGAIGGVLVERKKRRLAERIIRITA